MELTIFVVLQKVHALRLINHRSYRYIEMNTLCRVQSFGFKADLLRCNLCRYFNCLKARFFKNVKYSKLTFGMSRLRSSNKLAILFKFAYLCQKDLGLGKMQAES